MINCLFFCNTKSTQASLEIRTNIIWLIVKRKKNIFPIPSNFSYLGTHAPNMGQRVLS